MTRAEVNKLAEPTLKAMNSDPTTPLPLAQYIACLMSQRACKEAKNQEGVERYQDRLDQFWAQYKGK